MTLAARLRIGAEWTLVAHGPDTVELRTGVWNSRTLTLDDEQRQGHLWSVLKALRDGGDVGAIAADVGVSRREVESLVDQLAGLGVLDDQPRSALDTFLGASGRSAGVGPPTRIVLLGHNAIHDRVADDLRVHLDPPVEILDEDAPLALAVDRLGPHSFTDGLDIQELRERFAELTGAFVVCATTQNSPVRFTALDDLARIVGFTWLHATVDGPFVYVGPTVVPFRTASYRTFETRVAMNVRENESYLKYKSAMVENRVLQAGSTVFEPLAGLVAGHVALEVANWMATGSNFTVNKVLGIYLPTMEIAYHEILPLPGESPHAAQQNRDATGLYFDIREWLVDERVAAS